MNKLNPQATMEVIGKLLSTLNTIPNPKDHNAVRMVGNSRINQISKL